ncbi:hypothetical protein ACSMXM_05725 [Pacificimonas sp. ICDLI1SI03]
MTHDPQALIGRARHIAAEELCREKWKPGVKAGMYEDIMAGNADDEQIVRIALAALQPDLAAENARLREALNEIIYLDHHNMGPEGRATTIARAALSNREGK